MQSRRATILIGCLMLLHGMPLPTTLGAEPSATTGAVRSSEVLRALDVTLTAEGDLVGKLIDAQGNPASQARLVALRTNHPTSATTAEADGSFRLSDLKPGVYTVVYQDRSVLVRAWNETAAPPASKPAVLLVAGDVQRGQLGGLNPLAGSLSAQAFAVGVLTAAVAVPLVLSLEDDPSGS